MKKIIGLLIAVSLIVMAGTAFAAELKIGSRFYTKFLNRNTLDTSKYVTTGNGVGIRSELEITLDGRLSDRAEMGARLLTVWDPNTHITPAYSDWGGWFNDNANLLQVRGMWLRFRPATIPTLNSVLLGSTDLGMFNAWTIGKIRWIDRDNARIIYGEGEISKLKYGIGMTPMPSWWGPGWTIGPNTRSVWATGATLAFAPTQAINIKVTGSNIIAPQQDPAIPTDETKSVNRYNNNVGVLEVGFQPNPVYNLSGLIGVSNYSADKSLIGAAQGWWPQIPYDNVAGTAMKLTASASDPLGIGLTLKGEVFDVGKDFISIMAARRETKVLLSEGHVRYGANVNGSTWSGDVGYSPSVFVDNGVTDWNEANYQSCVGLKGITVIPEFRRGALGLKGEVSVMQSGFNSQNIDTVKYFWSAAKVDQSTNLAAIRLDYLVPFKNGLNVFGKYKIVNWADGVDTAISTDNMTRADTEIYAGATYQLTDELGLTGGYKNLNYVSKGNGANADTKTYELDAGMIFAELKYNVGGVDVGCAYEKIDGKENVGATSVRDMRFKATVEVKI